MQFLERAGNGSFATKIVQFREGAGRGLQDGLAAKNVQFLEGAGSGLLGKKNAQLVRGWCWCTKMSFYM